ncbi:oligopeptidase PepB [Enterococcus faecium]|uniref:Oligopeptidase F n=15 Tax=Bacilli TaxID=91061 RepID=A0A1S8HN92_ENTFC|nr:M03 family oligopeptidase F [Enterococcus faecium DO]APV55244.1 oligoendopeptidase F [Enterococcus faecium]EFR69462.1 oligoendopeptidase F [Enterococcus faecium TX0133a01]EFR72379.1 oligoendopeptidase F [Enterococcus faecium TX0133B]EFR74386.1 oligoendopeptidase F [Enterococcus faecium TX0133A]EFR79133.1 oligoendopeptidase F [Enterococcus faecium TX0133C]EFS07525.1 oligoendopeptidase F [Enterococcus faecium TX0133a04]EFS10043.1 oligoendopeptidase F [Enterococcus faecium TX0082]EJX41055.1
MIDRAKGRKGVDFMEVKQLPKREELPENLTWDLTKIFSSDQEFDEKYLELSEELKQSEKHKGTLDQGASQFLNAIEFVLRVYRQTEVIYVYAHLKNDQDTGNTDYQALYARASSLFSKVSEAVSWFEPEILQLSDDQIWQYFKEEPKLEVYRHYIQQIVDNRAHVLSAEQESLLAGAGEIFDASSDTFAVLNNADLVFPTIEGENGEIVQLSHGVYGQLLESTDRRVREAAFKGLYSVYEQFRNTFASTLGTHIKGHNFKAKVRNYSSAREASLSNNHIPESVYDTLVDVVNKHLPLLHRYMELRKRLLEVEKLHMYDLYTPVLGEAPITFTYEEAKEKALEALKPMGEEYMAIVEKAFSERWIDVVENKGKRSGAYSSGSYDTNPYILLNWHDTLDQLFTLVHEMGHSVHSYFTRSNQPYVYGDYSIFLAEIASTTNENILTEYLLETEKDPRVRAYVLNHYLDGFKGTVFRQTQFAEFEHFMHTEDEKGVPLTSEYLSDSYGKLNAKYYGPAVEEDPEIKFEWSRIPHFYYNYYVFQYSTGFSAASALAKKILNQEPEALENYLAYLKAGNSDYPVEVMKKAGVDMTQAAYIEDAMSMFEQRLNELEELIDRL